jgi:hypothetical protein
LIAAGSATRAAVEAVREAGQSVVADNGWMLLQMEGQLVERHPVQRPPRVSRRGPVPWGGLTVLRRLAEAAPLSQVQLAAVAKVGQPQVSKTLAALQVDGLVIRSARGWQVPDRDRLLDVWLARYPGPAGLTSHWYALDPLPDQLARAVHAHRERRVVLSGDMAADQLAAWRVPGMIQLYCTEPADLHDQGFVLSGQDKATLALTAPQDVGVFVPRAGEDPEQASGDCWAAMDTSSGPVELADPLQILADVASARGPDAAEAAMILRRTVVSEPMTTRLRDWLLGNSTTTTAALQEGLE